MGNIEFSCKKGSFFLRGIQGEKIKERIFQTKPEKKDKLNFYRSSNNFGYVLGNINFSEGCNNNLVISDQRDNRIYNTNNSLILINEGNIESFPISELEINFYRVFELMKNKKIVYHTPNKVIKRESLKEKNLEFLEKIIREHYSFCPSTIKAIKSSIKRNGLFYVSDDSSEYIFKYMGQDENRVEKIAIFANSLPSLFPKIKETINNKVSVALEDGIYWLEEFIKGDSTNQRNLDYFRKLGEYMAVMHSQLLKIIKKYSRLKNEFLTDSGHLSESNILSLWIDISFAKFNNLHSEINQIAQFKLNKKIECSPEYPIHGDLNRSNVIITPLQNFRFVDLERIKISRRLCELESPLIFGGNMAIPSYLEGSLKSILLGYNLSTEHPIRAKEQELIKPLIKYTLIKNFVVRNIRRMEKSNTLENLLTNLSLVDREQS